MSTESNLQPHQQRVVEEKKKKKKKKINLKNV